MDVLLPYAHILFYICKYCILCVVYQCRRMKIQKPTLNNIHGLAGRKVVKALVGLDTLVAQQLLPVDTVVEKG